ncbi:MULTISPECIES: DUF1572 family protein [unclassified Paenibacillus]|uniref:DUF1572 family protein n=1 Tax=unclassified Paenibacillus TaxID=185978 RepID=UPI001C11564F|nr:MULTISPECIES: DUF1572 family protein [unclassified Paenibacillus]MBU5440894.1 DUF1572 domain-containing protein [Paenibacillus sp. MSJ-34]CAH0118405.1 hypothetical protein PAE9249_00892 [Paenibacillus sp. CECT 9249]
MNVAAAYLQDAIRTFESMKKLADKTLEQLDDSQFYVALDPESNSMEILIQHMHGNMLSRWTDFLTTDGEKADRDRDGEFEAGRLDRRELLERWEQGWNTVFAALRALTADDLLRTVYIRGEAHTALQAIQRQVSHYAYHVGQMVFLGKHLKSGDWQTLSIPRRKPESK